MVEMKGPGCAILADSRGGAHIRACFIIIFLSAILSGVLFCIEAFASARNMKREIETVLDGLVIKEARREYVSLCDGSDDSTDIDLSPFFEELQSRFPGAAREGDRIVFRDEGGARVFSITVPEISVTESPLLRLSAVFLLSVPFRIGENEILDLTLPVTVRSNYYPKYS